MTCWSALADHRAAAQDSRPRHEEQLAQVEDEIKKGEEAVERYLLAFEAKTLPEGTCGERVHQLGGKLAALRHRRADLVADIELGAALLKGRRAGSLPSADQGVFVSGR